VTALSLCFLIVCAADPSAPSAGRVTAATPYFEAAIRAQDAALFVGQAVPNPSPPMNPASAGAAIPTLETPIPVATPEVYNPFQPMSLMYQPMGAPVLNDPFQPGADPVLTSPDLMGPMAPIYAGVNGPQPFRFGFIPRVDIGYVPESDVEGYDAGVEMFDLDTELRYNSPFAYGWVFSSAGQFNYRSWSFDGSAFPADRLNLYRFAWDGQLITPEVAGWQWQFTFNPSLNTDFEQQLTSDAWNFDAHIMAYYRVDPMVQVVLGVGYWDRLDDIVIPYAGVIILPDDRWELRLLFPKARISYFLGNCGGGSHWLYLSGEYRVESYQFELPTVPSRNQLQYEDWRLALGVRSDHGWFDKYIEVAWVLGRNFEFRTGIPKVDVDDSVLVRAGIRF